MLVHDVEPLLVIVAALIKLCQFFFHFTPRFLSRWKRRLTRAARRASSGVRRATAPRPRRPAAAAMPKAPQGGQPS